ncbi:MAG: hypothetical protein H6Q90_5885 [Deltaproteobacteria bacterium]|nr:hypothetical protein [Deltaproteobacteria bacterium]
MLEKRALGADSELLARDLLAGFVDVSQRSGLDGVLAQLEQAFAPLEIVDGAALSEDPRLRSALAEKLANKADYDPRGPRNAKPRQLADCLLATLSLTLSDEPDRTVTLSDDVRAEVMAALAGPVDAELAVPQIRETIIATGRELCEPRHLGSFDKITAQLDDTGMRMIRQPKVPLDAVQAVQQLLYDARNAVIARAANAAIDRAQQVLARVDAEAAARIDQPITLRLTPRDVAIRRACEPRVPKMPGPIVLSLFESLTEMSHFAWRAVEQPVRPYAASQTFAVGDQLLHPKFGRGSVLSTATQRIEVEFAEGKYTLVHARAGS